MHKIKNILLLSLLFSGSVFADAMIARGVNYDPVHSLEFAKAVGLDDGDGMINAIYADLDKLAQLRAYNNNEFQSLNHLKTFFTVFSSAGLNGNMVNINIADVVNQWNEKNPTNKLTVALGVYEFRPTVDSCKTESECISWTQAQVQASIEAANRYGSGLIDRIIVGNEDINADHNDNKNMLVRVTDDSKRIKAALNDPNIKVGTAQVTSIVQDIFSTTAYNDLKANVDFIGVNVYPFWGGSAYESAKNDFDDYWRKLNTIRTMEVIETEEGWPSAGYDVGSAKPSANSEHDYFYYWFYRDSPKRYLVPVSYLFALFDKLPGQQTESHWGIYSADRNASILDGDYTKPLANNHPLVVFTNSISKGKSAEIIACMDDWNKETESQGTCFPIYGYPGTGNIAGYKQKEFMLDTSGQSYASLMVVYQGDNNQRPRLCYIDKQTLSTMNANSKVTLVWQNAQGNVPCKVE